MKFNFFIICAFLVLTINASAQEMNKNLFISVEVKCVDSQYVMIPNIHILRNEDKIKIHKKINYGNEMDVDVDCNFFLQKLIGKAYVNMYTTSFRQNIFDEDFTKLVTIKNSSVLFDTIKLSNYSPIEPGEYRLSINFKYFENGIEKVIFSKWTDFSVLFRSKSDFW